MEKFKSPCISNGDSNILSSIEDDFEKYMNISLLKSGENEMRANKSASNIIII